ncbi:MAG: ABC transporter transmembrane domain-containing protein, partial [Candidatus Ornithomonoglobus sp.]
MLNKRLINLLPGIGIRTAKSVFWEWLALICSIAVTICVCIFLNKCFIEKSVDFFSSMKIGIIILACVILRAVTVKLYSDNSAATARDVKKLMRECIFDRLCKIGVSYKKHISTAEAVQVSVEGIDQLEAYFSQYMPQLFYALASTLTLFVFLCFISIKTAVVLLICVPIIPLSIIGVQKIATRLLSKYWDSYTTLGDSFLENIQGLTTLKIYRSDDMKHKEMNRNAEAFRKGTMRVLIMQLNSISIMDIVSYGGAAAGITAAVYELAKGNITFFSAMVTVLLSAEFFIPFRQLGSFFHVAMNGAAAADKIFRILDTEIAAVPDSEAVSGADISFNNVSFAYDSDKTVLRNISLTLPGKGLYALAGQSGCGKSTFLKTLNRMNDLVE